MNMYLSIDFRLNVVLPPSRNVRVMWVLLDISEKLKPIRVVVVVLVLVLVLVLVVVVVAVAVVVVVVVVIVVVAFVLLFEDWIGIPEWLETSQKQVRNMQRGAFAHVHPSICWFIFP